MTINIREEDKIKVDSPESLYPILRDILLRESEIDQDKEHLWAIGLSNNLKLLYIELIGLGTQNMVVVEPMEVYSWALQKRCAYIVLAHNHPSGDLTPSIADKEKTERLIQVGKIVQLYLVDHMIISTESFYSFKETGLMEELEGSTKFVPPFVLAEEYKENAEKERNRSKKLEDRLSEKNEELETKKNQVLSIARILKKEGRSLEYIRELTNLSTDEINKL